MGKAMRQIYVKENAHGEFSTEQYYYPLLDIVTISITKELLGYTVDDIYSIFKSVGMDRDKLKDTMNIANIAYDVSCDFLVFTIIPIAKAYEHDSRVSRRVRTLCFLRAA